MKDILKYLKDVYTDWFLIKIQIYLLFSYLIIFTTGGILINNIVLGILFGFGVGISAIVSLLFARYLIKK